MHAYNTHKGALSSALPSFSLSKSLSFSKKGGEKRAVTRSASCVSRDTDTGTGGTDIVSLSQPVPSKARMATRFTTRRAAAPTAESSPQAASRAHEGVDEKNQRPVSVVLNYDLSEPKGLSEQSLLKVWDSEGQDEKTLGNSYSLGSLKSVSGGSEATQDSDRTRVEDEGPQFSYNAMQRKPSGIRSSGDPAVYIRKHASLRESATVKKLFKFEWRGRSPTIASTSSTSTGRGEEGSRRGAKRFVNTNKERRCVKHEMPSICIASTVATKLSTSVTRANIDVQKMPPSPISSFREAKRNLTKNASLTTTILGSATTPPTFESTNSSAMPTPCSALVSDVVFPAAFGSVSDSGPSKPSHKTTKKLARKTPASASANVGIETLVSSSRNEMAGRTCWSRNGDTLEMDSEIIDKYADNSRVDSNGETAEDNGVELDDLVEPSRGGLTLKRSFKLGVGRTLGPSLTLAAATEALGELVVSPRAVPLFADDYVTTAKSGDCVDKNHDVVVGQFEESRRVGKWDWDYGGESGMNLERTSARLQTLQMPTPRHTPIKEKARVQILSKAKMGEDVALPPTNITPHTSCASMKPSPSSKTGSVGASPRSPSPTFPMIFRGSFSSEGRRSLSPMPWPPTSPLDAQFLGHGISGQPETPSSPHSTSTSRRRSATSPLRLSAMTIGSVKNAFAGVIGGVFGSRTSTTTSFPQTRNMSNHPSLNTIASSTGDAMYGAGAFEGGEIMITDDGSYGDFMDLRDPFASPPPGSVKSTPNRHAREGLMDVDSSEDGHRGYQGNVFVGSTGGHSRGEFGRRMSAWGKFPITTKRYSNSVGGTNNRAVGLGYALSPVSSISRSGGVQKWGAAHPNLKPRRSRKERRMRKSSTLGVVKNTGSKVGVSENVTKVLGDEDIDFDVEEALLAQKLLKRLNDERRV